MTTKMLLILGPSFFPGGSGNSLGIYAILGHMRTAVFRGSVCSLIRGWKPRADVLGGLVGISFILLVTTISSSAGPENGWTNPSRPAFSVISNHAVVARTGVLGHALYYTGYRTEGVHNFRGPIFVAPRWRSNPENVGQNSMSSVAEPRTQDVTPQAKDPNRMIAPQSLMSRGQGTTPSSISPPHNPISPPHNPISPPANPINRPNGLNPQTPSAMERSATAANINHKFQQAENKVGNEPGRSLDRRNRLEQSRVFFVGLIDAGYPLSLLDTWCDDLLDDQVDTGMPIDLIDSYWGQPISTQEYEEYYTPYDVCTYQTPNGDYRQVTFQNGVVTPGL
jgi:hypothetical protein